MFSNNFSFQMVIRFGKRELNWNLKCFSFLRNFTETPFVAFERSNQNSTLNLFIVKKDTF